MTPTSSDPALPDLITVERTMAAMEARGFHALHVATGADALRTVFDLVPPGSRVAHGSSTTLRQIGLVDALTRGERGYEYANGRWMEEADPQTRTKLRGQLSLGADYFLGSVQAIAETGEVVGSDAGGGRQAFYVFGPPHVIWVAGINKIVPTLDAAIRRVREVALPQEDRRMKSTGAAGSFVGKLVIYERERPGRITAVLVGETLGY